MKRVEGHFHVQGLPMSLPLSHYVRRKLFAALVLSFFVSARINFQCNTASPSLLSFSPPPGFDRLCIFTQISALAAEATLREAGPIFHSPSSTCWGTQWECMILGAGECWANDPTLTCFPLLPHVHTTRWVPFDKERRCLAFVMREIRMHANEPYSSYPFEF